jgi:hypothetical protein
VNNFVPSDESSWAISYEIGAHRDDEPDVGVLVLKSVKQGANKSRRVIARCVLIGIGYR